LRGKGELKRQFQVPSGIPIESWDPTRDEEDIVNRHARYAEGTPYRPVTFEVLQNAFVDSSTFARDDDDEQSECAFDTNDIHAFPSVHNVQQTLVNEGEGKRLRSSDDPEERGATTRDAGNRVEEDLDHKPESKRTIIRRREPLEAKETCPTCWREYG
jgi:hypothetical protein